MRDKYTLTVSVLASVVLLFVALSNRSWIFVFVLLLYLAFSVYSYRND